MPMKLLSEEQWKADTVFCSFQIRTSQAVLADGRFFVVWLSEMHKNTRYSAFSADSIGSFFIRRLCRHIRCSLSYCAMYTMVSRLPAERRICLFLSSGRQQGSIRAPRPSRIRRFKRANAESVSVACFAPSA